MTGTSGSRVAPHESERRSSHRFPTLPTRPRVVNQAAQASETFRWPFGRTALICGVQYAQALRANEGAAGLQERTSYLTVSRIADAGARPLRDNLCWELSVVSRPK